MKFALTQQISEAQLGYEENDDCAFSVEIPGALYAWVIDGSTSLAQEKSHVGAALKDVAWYSRALSEALRAHAHQALSPKVLHALAADEVARAYERAVGAALDSIPLYERPSAAVTLLRVGASAGELFYLGDCPAFTLSQTEEVARLTDEQPTDGEQDLRRRVKESQAGKALTAKEVFQQQLTWLRAARQAQLASRPLEVSAALRGVEFGGRERRFDLSRFSAIVLMSDGFERYAAQYAMGSYAAMVQSVVKQGVESILRPMRALEGGDPEVRAIPRLKVSDDATCLVLTRAED